jgi:6,7-dimethyl-8-ribityllumazine synthase
MELQGSRQARGRRFAIAVSRFNEPISEGLLRGACTTLEEAGVAAGDVTIVRVPGAFELPLTARLLAESGTVDAVICLGCVIKGETMHFEYISSAVSQGIMAAAAETKVPVTFGVLTTLTDGQAEARSADNGDNKGREAALAAIEMVSLVDQITQKGSR